MAVDVPQLASAHDDARRDRARATWPAFWVSAVIMLVGLLESALLPAAFLGAIPALEYLVCETSTLSCTS